MGRWLVTQGDHQFSAADLGELKDLATSGSIGPGDMVQPPGASDWLYASEIADLADCFGSDDAVDDDFDDWDLPKTRSKGPLVAFLLAIVAIGGYGMYHYGSQLPKHEDLEILGGTTGCPTQNF